MVESTRHSTHSSLSLRLEQDLAAAKAKEAAALAGEKGAVAKLRIAAGDAKKAIAGHFEAVTRLPQTQGF